MIESLTAHRISRILVYCDYRLKSDLSNIHDGQAAKKAPAMPELFVCQISVHGLKPPKYQ
jgi:hypothetical protein